MKKKMLSLFLLLVLTFSFAACARQNHSTDTGTGFSSVEVSGTVTDGNTTDPLSSSQATDSQVQTDVSSSQKTDENSEGASDTNYSSPSDSENTSTKGSNAYTDNSSSGRPSQGASDSGNPTDSGSNSNTGTTSDSGSSDNSSKEETLVFDANRSHTFLAVDQRNCSIVMYDLTTCADNLRKLGSSSEYVLWEWKAYSDPNFLGGEIGFSLDAAKYRYSVYYKKNVIIACSSKGWAGVIDCDRKTVLWQYVFREGYFHSIEMMPNGDVVIAGSENNGKIYYVPLSAGETVPSSTLSSPHAHGVSYDPERKLLWVLDYDEVYACTVSGYGTANATLSRVAGKATCFTNDGGGHAFSPVHGQPGKYWVSSNSRVYIFDAETLALTALEYPYSKALVKGIAGFSDGTVILTVAGVGNPATTYGCTSLTVITTRYKPNSKDPVTETTLIPFPGREFYKVFPLTTSYQ